MAQVRIQKILSERGVASRRKAEELIEQGKVKVNGRVAHLGDKADDRKDIIHVCGKPVAQAEMPVYVMLNKPRGYITTMSDEQGRKCVAELVESVGVRVYPVGRLDRESEGMLLFTNDGDFSNAMMHPTAHVPKNYRVTVRGTVTDEQIQTLHEGIVLDGRKTAEADVIVLTEEPERTVLEIVLYEGRNREIRRMCETLGLEVMRLRRVAMGGVKMGTLPVGKWRYLDPKEVRTLLMAAQVDKKIAAAYIKNGRGGAPRDHRVSRR